MMKKLIVFILVLILTFNISSFDACRQYLAKGMQFNNKSEVFINDSDSCKYTIQIEYNTMETKDIESMNSNKLLLENDDKYIFYDNCSGDNIWHVVKVYAEEAFYITDIFINFTCNVTNTYGAISYYFYNPDTEEKSQCNVLPDPDNDIKIEGFFLHAWFNTPLSPGTWYFVLLSGNKINCEYNLTIITSEPYDFSVNNGSSSILYKGNLFYKSIDIKNSLIGWFSPVTPSSYNNFLTFSKYSITTPSNVKTKKGFIGINGHWKPDGCEWGPGNDDCFFNWLNSNILFSSEHGIWKFKGLTLKIGCFSQIILLYADVVLPE